MKFIASLAFVATVSATLVRITPDEKCKDILVAPSYTKCGANVVPPLDFFKTGAQIIHNDDGVIFYKNWRCTGEKFEVKPGPEEKQCFDLEKAGFDPVKPACVFIVCA